jgi:hypothetical protein
MHVAWFMHINFKSVTTSLTLEYKAKSKAIAESSLESYKTRSVVTSAVACSQTQCP